jgi:RNA polymerase sigma factor (sigma-70 family)
MEPLTTHPSLLSRVRDVSNRAAWREFESRYGPLVLHYCRRRGLQHSDAEDVRQIVLLNLTKALPKFSYSRERGRFRSYLGQIVKHAISLYQSRPQAPARALDAFEAVLDSARGADAVDDPWEEEWVAHHFRLAMQSIRATFEPRSLLVFERLLAGGSAAQVAEEFDMSAQAVNKVKQRIRLRLREQIARQMRDEDEIRRK